MSALTLVVLLVSTLTSPNQLFVMFRLTELTVLRIQLCLVVGIMTKDMSILCYLHVVKMLPYYLLIILLHWPTLATQQCFQVSLYFSPVVTYLSFICAHKTTHWTSMVAPDMVAKRFVPQLQSLYGNRRMSSLLLPLFFICIVIAGSIIMASSLDFTSESASSSSYLEGADESSQLL